MVSLASGVAVCECTSGIAVSCGRVGCSPPQEVRSKRKVKHNIARAGSLEFRGDLLGPAPLDLSVVFTAIFGSLALPAGHGTEKSLKTVE